MIVVLLILFMIVIAPPFAWQIGIQLQRLWYFCGMTLDPWSQIFASLAAVLIFMAMEFLAGCGIAIEFEQAKNNKEGK